MRTILIAWTAFSCLCIGAQPQTREGSKIPAPSIRFLMGGSNGLTEVIPDADVVGTAAGDRGCRVSTESDCPDSAKVTGVANRGEAGQPIVVAIDGAGKAQAITILRNGEAVESRQDVDLPVEFDLKPADASEVVSVHVQTAAGSASSSFRVEAPAAMFSTNGTAPRIEYFVRYDGGYYEVITGSNTGGRFVRGIRGCVLPNVTTAACPASWLVRGYTDRAVRLESIITTVTASGVASRLGVIISGQVRGQWFNVPLPVVVPQTVSGSVFDDNIYAFVVLNGVHYERRLPLGARR